MRAFLGRTAFSALAAAALLGRTASAGAREPVRATVRSVEGDVVELDAGSASGVEIGMRFRVLTLGKVVRIPLTGFITYSEGMPIALVRVLETEDLTSRCKVESREPGAEIAPGLDAVSLSGLQVSDGSGAGATEIGSIPALPGSTGFAPGRVAVAADPARPEPGQAVKLTVKGVEKAEPGYRVRWSAERGALLAEETAGPQVTWIACRDRGQYEIRATVVFPDDTRRYGSGVLTVSGTATIPAEAHEEKAMGPRAFAGGPVEPVDAAFDREGGMFLLDGRRKCIWLVERGGKVREAVSRDRFTEAAVKAPRAVALSGDRIYLLDTASPWVKVFDPADRFIMALKGDVEMRDPVDIAVDSRGMVYVADRKATCFHIYGSDGSYMNPRGTRGKESGDFLSPVAVAVSPEGRLLVLDEKRADIQVFDPDFRFLDRFVMREGRNAPVDLALTADGRSIFVLEGPDPAVAEYDSRGNPRAHSRDRAGLFPGLPGRASRIAVDGLGRVHVLPGGTTGVHRYTASGEGLGTFGVERPGDPMRVAVDDAGNFAILDASPPHVRLYDSDGWRLNRIGKPEERDRPFRKPHALAVTRRGLVAATLSHITRGAFDPMVDAPSVNVFQPNGTRTRSAGTYGRDTNQILRATDLDVDARGNVYVVDAGQRRISVFSATERRGGTAPDLTWKIPTEGKTAQDMAAPALIAVDAETADYYLYDAKLRQIKKFNRDKFFLGVVDGESVGFQSVERMRVDNLGLLWILDARKGEVSRVDFRQAVASVKARIPTAAIRGGVRDLGVDATGRVYILAGDDTVHVYR